MTKKVADRSGKRSTSSSSGKTTRAPAQQLSAAQLFQQAQIALQYDDFDGAKDAFKRALKLEPQNVDLLEAYGSLLAELGEGDAAKEVLMRAVELSPEKGHEKYMYLSQLAVQADQQQQGLQLAQKGCALLQATLDAAAAAAQRAAADAEAAASAAAAAVAASGRKPTSSARSAQAAAAAAAEAAESAAADVSELRQQLCGALCSLAEMTLGCATEAAAAAAVAAGKEPESASGVDAAVAQEVEQLCARAAATYPKSPEPGQVLASLLYEQGRSAEALTALRQSMALWYRPVSESSDDEDDDEWEEGDEDEAMEAEQEQQQGQQEKCGSKGGKSKDEAADSEADAMEEDGEEEQDDAESLAEPSYEFRFECAKLLLELDENTKDAVVVLSDLVQEDDSQPDAWHLLALALYSGHEFEEAAEMCAKGQAVMSHLGIGPEEPVHAQFAELSSAIAEALGKPQ